MRPIGAPVDGGAQRSSITLPFFDHRLLTGGTREPSQDSGSSVSSSPSHAHSVDEEAAAENAAAGVASPDDEQYHISMVPLVFAAAARCMSFKGHALVFIPLLHQLSDEWQQREITDCSVLVAKLFLMRRVMGWDTVLLSELLGAIDVGPDNRCDFEVDIPMDNFSVHQLNQQLEGGQFRQLMARLEVDGQWALVGPKNFGPDSWLLLKEHETGRLRVLYLQSKARKNPEAYNAPTLQTEAAKRWEPSEPHSLLLYVTNQHAPKRPRTQLTIPPRVVVVHPANHDKYYSCCMAFIKASLAKHGPLRVVKLEAMQ